MSALSDYQNKYKKEEDTKQKQSSSEALSAYQNKYKGTQNTVAQPEVKNEVDDRNWIQRLGSSVGNSILSGTNQFASGLAGAWDSVSSALIQDEYKADLQRENKKVYDTLSNRATNQLQNAVDANAFGNGKFNEMMVNAMSSTVSSGLSSATSAVTGLAAPEGASLVRQAIAMLPFGASAYGSSFEQALNENPNISRSQAALYGGAEGLKEVGTELMFQGVGLASKVSGGRGIDDLASDKLQKALYAMGKTDKGGKVLAKIGELAVGAAGEGIEEVVGDVLDVFTPIILGKGLDIDSVSLGNLLTDFTVGAMSGLMGEGLGSVGQAVTGRAVENYNNSIQAKFFNEEFNEEYSKAENKAELLNDIIENGLIQAKDTTAYKVATEMQARQQNGETVSAEDMGRLYTEFRKQQNTELETQQMLADMSRDMFSSKKKGITYEGFDSIRGNDLAMSELGLSNEKLSGLADNSARLSEVENALKGYGKTERTTETQNADQSGVKAEDNKQPSTDTGYNYRDYARDSYSAMALSEAAKNIGGRNGGVTLINALSGSIGRGNIAAYVADAYKLYNEGKTGKKATNLSGVLNEFQAEMMRNAGEMDAKENRNEVSVQRSRKRNDNKSSRELQEGEAYSATGRIVKARTEAEIAEITKRVYEIADQYGFDKSKIHLVEDYITDTGRGMFDPETGEITIMVNHRAFTAEQLFKHELFHSILAGARNGNETYVTEIVDAVRKLTDDSSKIDALCEAYAQAYASNSGMDVEAIYEEMLCDAFGGMNEAAHGYEVAELTFKSAQEALVKEGTKRVEATRGSPISNMVENGEIRQSQDTFMNASGIQCEEVDGRVRFTFDGKEVKKVTAKHIENFSGFGVLIKNAENIKTEAERQKQYQAVADICNMILKTNDVQLAWAYTGSMLFSAVKSNSDSQYGTTVDFSTVCRKTQEMITAMSEAMMEKGEGLTKAEVTELQKKLNENDLNVPCPVCYVFSRWAGIGNTLDNIWDLQEKYKGYTKEQLKARTAELEKEVKRRGGKPGTVRGEIKKELQAKIDELKEEVTKLSAEKEAIETYKYKNSEARLAEINKTLPKLQEDLDIVSDYTWVANIMSRADYKPVPKNVLYNLDGGAEFAKNYPAVWKYRTTRGPGAGKAIVPYSPMVLGDLILKVDKGANTGNTLFKDLKGDFNKKQKDALKSAKKRVKAQNLLGGQRFQSTSDFRYEYALDYFQAFLELQTLGSTMQTYTKVVEFADMVASIGGDVNLSLMPLGSGYDANDNLIFSSVTGINPEAAFEVSAKFDSAQPILVGINDHHIELAMRDDRITFIIPYHASGASITDFIQHLVKNLGENWDKSNYQDYSKVQTDSEIEENNVLRDIRKKILTKTKSRISGDELKLIRTMAGQAKDISGMSFDELLEIERKAISGDKNAQKEYRSWSAGVLSGLYDRMMENGAVLSSTQSANLMPHEYWNKSTTIDNAYVNGFIFRSYCYNLGLAPRFTGINGEGKKMKFGDFSGERGYWKTLIDRAMYDLKGNYRDQNVVSMSKFQTEMLEPSYAEKNYGKYKIKEPSLAKAKEIGRQFAKELKEKETVTVATANPNQKFSIDTSGKYSFASFFSGAGTVDYALRDMANSKFAVEWDKYIAQAFGLNNDGIMFNMSVDDVDLTQFRGQIYHFHASPVCCRYSRAINVKGNELNEADSALDMSTAMSTARALDMLRPAVFTVENVKDYRGSKALKQITDMLDKLGYKYDIGVYNSADYGAATSRERMFLRAFRPDVGELPAMPEAVKTRTTWYERVKDLIPGLPERPFSPYMLQRAKDGGLFGQKEPIIILGGNKGKGLSWAPASKPAPTVIARSAEARILMPDGRVLRATPQVIARIQGLGDSFNLPMRKDMKGIALTRAYKVLGNGVPVELTKAVVEPLIRTAEQKVQKYSEDTDVKTQKAIAFNAKQSVGDKLMNTDYKPTGRYKGIVGKEVGTQLYVHKNYADEVIDSALLDDARELLANSEYSDFKYKCIMYDKAKNTVRFDEAPNFDTATEPIAGDNVTVNLNDGTVKSGRFSGQIWHHKWEWVKNDYTGFDVEEAWNRSREYYNKLREVPESEHQFKYKANQQRKPDGSFSGQKGIDAWNEQLEYYGLPLYEDTSGYKYSEDTLATEKRLKNGQKHTSEDTSVIQIASTFTHFNFPSNVRLLDYGGGQYNVMKDAFNVIYPEGTMEIMDAFNRTNTHNNRISKMFKKNPADVVTVNNVLNVIDSRDARIGVIQSAYDYLSDDGYAIFLCYKSGKKGAAGKDIDTGNYQTDMKLSEYKPEVDEVFEHSEIVGNYIIASKSPIDLAKVKSEFYVAKPDSSSGPANRFSVMAIDWKKNKGNYANIDSTHSYRFAETTHEELDLLYDYYANKEMYDEKKDVHFVGDDGAIESIAEFVGWRENLSDKEIKALSKVKRDAEGNVIPLSERVHIREENVKWSEDVYTEYDKPITMADVLSLREQGRKHISQFTTEDLRKSQKWAYKYYKELGTKSPFFRAWFGDWRAYDSTPVKIAVVPFVGKEGFGSIVNSQKGIVVNRDTGHDGNGWSVFVGREGINNTKMHSGKASNSYNSSTGIAELIENGILLDSEIHEHHTSARSNEKDNIAFNHRLYSIGRFNGTISLYRINVEDVYSGRNNQNDMRFHNLKYIEKIADIVSGPNRIEYGAESAIDELSAISYTVADLYELVKRYDPEFDNNQKPVAKEILNPDGTPKVFYHGTKSYFDAFSKDFFGSATDPGWYGRGFYFTDKKRVAEYYARYFRDSHVMETYLHMENPFILKVAKGDNKNRVIEDIIGQRFDDAVERSEAFTDWLKSEGYDGVIFENQYIVFEPNQIKSATDNIGTFDSSTDKLKYSEDTMDYTDLVRENRELRKKYEYWKGQTRLTKAPSFTDADAKKYAKEIIKAYDSKVDINEVLPDIKKVIEDVWLKNKSYEDAKKTAGDIARKIVMNAEALINGSEYEKYKEIKNYLKDKTFYITLSDRMSIPDYEQWRKNHRYIKVVIDDAKANMDKMYQDVRSTFSTDQYTLFPDVSNGAEQLLTMAESIDSLDAVYDNPFSNELADAIEGCANEIIDLAFDRMAAGKLNEKAPTFADKAKKKEEDAFLAGQMSQGADDARHYGSVIRNLEDRRQRTVERLQEVRQKRDEEIYELKMHFAEVQNRKRVRKEESEARQKLLKIVNRLSNKKMTAANRALIDSMIADIDKTAVGISEGKVKQLEDLRDWYNTLVSGGILERDERIENQINRLNLRHIKDMSIGDVRTLANVLLGIEYAINHQNKLIESQYNRDMWWYGMETAKHIRETDDSTNAMDDFFVTKTLSPLRAMKRFTGYNKDDALVGLTNELAEGQRKSFDYVRRAEALFTKYTNDKKFIDSITGKNAKLIDCVGSDDEGNHIKFQMTPAMRMSLYLHFQNADNMRHIISGGITVPNYELYKKGDMAEAYAKSAESRVFLTMRECESIINGMTAKEKNFADAMHDYFNGMSQNEINVTSEALKGYSLADVENYFPIDTDKTTLQKDYGTVKPDGAVSGLGFTHERVKAGNAIYLYDATMVLNKSVEAHAKYVGLSIPVRNMSKLMSTGGVSEALSAKWGTKATHYIEKMMEDVQNVKAREGDPVTDLFGKLRSNYAGAVLTLNAGVAMKQAASYFTAASVLGYSPLLKAKGELIHSTVDINKVSKYTPLLWYRARGYSSTELGDLKSRDKQIPKALNWIQTMDLKTTTALWKACEYYVREQNPGKYNTSSDEFGFAVAEVYNRVIEETQPNYSAMQRPEWLRTKQSLTQALMMFKTQPFQNFNILYDSIAEYKAVSRRAITTGDYSEVAEARKAMSRAVTSQLASAITFVAIQAAWDAFRGKHYGDDDDENTVGGWLKKIGANILSAFTGMLPIVSTAFEAVEAIIDNVLKNAGLDAIFDQKYYGLSVSPVEVFNDIEGALQNISGKATKILSGNSKDTMKDLQSLFKSALKLAEAEGVPASNVINLFESITHPFGISIADLMK